MNFKETEVLELKKSTSELKEAVISIASILNKHRQGELYFGIKNDGTIPGQTVTEKTIREISRMIGDNIEPKIYPKIEKVKIEGRDCIMLSFSGENAPYFAFGRAYIRVGDEDRQLSVAELEKLILEKNKEKMQWDTQPADCSIKDIGSKVVREFVKKANEAGRIDFEFESVQTTLKKLSYIKNGKLLRAAQVLFSKKNPLKVQAAVFAGTERLTFLDIQQFEGNLFELLKVSEEYIKQRINWRVKFGRLEREEIPEIPIDALREAIVNSLCHRDYYAPESNKIAIFKNRIEIYNPGQFPAGLTPEDFIRKPEQSVLRNPLIAEGLYRTKDIEKWGSGLKRIFDECKANNVKVEFQLLKTGFQVVFYRNVAFEGSTLKTTPKTTPKTQEAIIELITKKPEITKEEIAREIGITLDGIKYHVRKLRRQKIISWEGPSKGGHWKVIKK